MCCGRDLNPRSPFGRQIYSLVRLTTPPPQLVAKRRLPSSLVNIGTFGLSSIAPLKIPKEFCITRISWAVLGIRTLDLLFTKQLLYHWAKTASLTILLGGQAVLPTELSRSVEISFAYRQAQLGLTLHYFSFQQSSRLLGNVWRKCNYIRKGGWIEAEFAKEWPRRKAYGRSFFPDLSRWVSSTFNP